MNYYSPSDTDRLKFLELRYREVSDDIMLAKAEYSVKVTGLSETLERIKTEIEAIKKRKRLPSGFENMEHADER
jgi:hypothetical protein